VEIYSQFGRIILKGTIVADLKSQGRKRVEARFMWRKFLGRNERAGEKEY